MDSPVVLGRILEFLSNFLIHGNIIYVVLKKQELKVPENTSNLFLIKNYPVNKQELKVPGNTRYLFLVKKLPSKKSKN